MQFTIGLPLSGYDKFQPLKHCDEFGCNSFTQFYAPGEDGSVQWRSPKEMPPSTIAIHSPYDVAAHYSSKRSVDWVGYKVHITETCDRDCPRFITGVCTTLSTIPDDAVVESVHQTLPLEITSTRRAFGRYGVHNS